MIIRHKANLTDKWVDTVSRCTCIAPNELRKNIQSWLDLGRSVEYIKQGLITTAYLRTGKMLHFVSKNGKN